LGFPKDFSDSYGEAYNNAGFQTTYRTSKVGISGSQEEGVKISIEAMNFIEIRGEKVGAVATGGTGSGS
jgi:hypothetical protein